MRTGILLQGFSYTIERGEVLFLTQTLWCVVCGVSRHSGTATRVIVPCVPEPRSRLYHRGKPIRYALTALTTRAVRPASVASGQRRARRPRLELSLHCVENPAIRLVYAVLPSGAPSFFWVVRGFGPHIPPLGGTVVGYGRRTIRTQLSSLTNSKQVPLLSGLLDCGHRADTPSLNLGCFRLIAEPSSL